MVKLKDRIGWTVQEILKKLESEEGKLDVCRKYWGEWEGDHDEGQVSDDGVVVVVDDNDESKVRKIIIILMMMLQMASMITKNQRYAIIIIIIIAQY